MKSPLSSLFVVPLCRRPPVHVTQRAARKNRSRQNGCFLSRDLNGTKPRKISEGTFSAHPPSFGNYGGAGRGRFALLPIRHLRDRQGEASPTSTEPGQAR